MEEQLLETSLSVVLILLSLLELESLSCSFLSALQVVTELIFSVALSLRS